MVDIIPYTSDDEDQTNWVPLTSSVPNPTSNNATSAASSKEDTNNTKQNATMNVNSDNATSNKLVSQDDIVFVDTVDNEKNEEDEDQDWQTISSSSPPPTTQQHTTKMQSSADAPSQEWSWGQQLITHLTTTTTATPSSASALKVEDDNISDTEGDDNIVWSKPNAIQDDNIERIRVKRDEREQFGRKKMVEEEYTDISSSMKQKKKVVVALKQQKQLHTTSVEEDIDEEEVVWQKPNEETAASRQEKKKKSSSPQFKHIPSQAKPQPKTTSTTTHQKQPDEQRSGQQTIKTKLQQTLIHDPLYALPFCFLKHLYYETKLHIMQTYTVYVEQHELSYILAPLLLVVIVSLFGLTLIAIGLYNFGTLLVQGVVHGSVNFGSWLMNYSLSMAGIVVWWSICSSVLLGIGIWIWSKVNEYKASAKEENDEIDNKSFHVPSISTMLPWAIALSSTAFYEAIVILFSLRIYLSVLTVDDGMRVEECVDEKDQYCLPDASDQSTSSMSLLSTCILVLLLAVINVSIVSVAANILDQNDTSQMVTNTTFSKSYKQIQKHLPACHIISIATFTIMSILTLLMQALYVHYLQQGGNVLYTLVNQLGTVGYNSICIGVGVFTLVTLWNVTMSSISTNDTILGISFGEISRNALKQSIIEISSRAVWSDKDMGSSLLGILSDDDGALRLAILEWIIDRWATSKKSEDQAISSSATSTQDNTSPSSVTEKCTDPDNSSQDKDNSTDPPSFQSQTKQSTEDSSSFIPPPNNSGSTSSSQVLPSYQSLQAVIARLDADETLIPTIKRYRVWVYSLPPSRNAAVCVALWKLCPALTIMSLWIGVTGIAQLCMLFLSSLGVLTAQYTTGLFGLGILGIVLMLLSPILCIEYLRVSQWWAKTTCHLKTLEYDSQASNDGQTQRDLVMILLQSDSTDDYSESTTGTTFLFGTSSFLLRIWHLLEESISVLESSIPVVRSLTVASSVADLSTDAICLVDLALEVKKRGWLGGAGIIIYDAFTHHLSKEIQQRKQESSSSSTHQDRGSDDTEEEELGGQYTASIMNAVGNVGKISHNVSCLIQKDEHDVKDDEDFLESSLPQSANQDEDTSSEIKSTHGKVEESSKEASPSIDKDVPVSDKDGNINPNQGEEEASSQEKSDDNEQSNDGDGGGLIPFLIGGGLALAGTVAGIALHNNGQDDEDKRRRKNQGR